MFTRTLDDLYPARLQCSFVVLYRSPSSFLLQVACNANGLVLLRSVWFPCSCLAKNKLSACNVYIHKATTHKQGPSSCLQLPEYMRWYCCHVLLAMPTIADASVVLFFRHPVSPQFHTSVLTTPNCSRPSSQLITHLVAGLASPAVHVILSSVVLFSCHAQVVANDMAAAGYLLLYAGHLQSIVSTLARFGMFSHLNQAVLVVTYEQAVLTVAATVATRLTTASRHA